MKKLFFAPVGRLVHANNLRVSAWLACWLVAAVVFAQQPPDAATTGRSAGKRVALIVVGLPGDEPHAELFRATGEAWVNWLTKTLAFEPDNVIVLSGREVRDESAAGNRGPATLKSVESRVAALKQSLSADDALWVFFLGHANDEDGHAAFHLPGPDLDDRKAGDWFSGFACREQIFWLTNTCSGYFLKPLSQSGRIVITATVPDAEINETEFPQALVTTAQRNPKELDADGDRRLSVAELFDAVVREVDARFAADLRIATEHALLDDNGDGRGTEAADLARPISSTSNSPENAQPEAAGRDGLFAASVFLPIRQWPAAETPVDPEAPPEP